MNEFQFKTNINCASCVGAVSSFLNEIVGIEYWTVNTQTAEKILTVSGEVSENEIIVSVAAAGFSIEKIIQ